MSLPTVTSEYLIKSIFTGEAAPTVPGNWFASLHTGHPGQGGDNEVTAGADANYARQATDFEAATLDGQLYETSNNADVEFPAAETGAEYTVTHIAVQGSASAGTDEAWLVYELPTSKTVTGGDVFRFPINELVIQGALS